jgi:hypothetical protein
MKKNNTTLFGIDSAGTAASETFGVLKNSTMTKAFF